MDIFLFIDIYFAVTFTLLGIVIGSFLNVVIYRTPAGRKFSTGRSMCMTCGHELAAKDLVPLFSWLFLRGKCRYCKAPIASRYAKIESFTGAVFLLVAITHPECSWFLTDYTNPTLLLFFLDYLLFVVACAAAIATMMIHYDTGKSFFRITGFILIPAVVSKVIWAFMGIREKTFMDLLHDLLFLLIYIGGTVLVCFILTLLMRKKYTRNDLYLDMSFVPLMTFSLFTGITYSWITISIYAVIYGLARAILKGREADRYTGIGSFLLVVILVIIRYFIYR